MALERKDKSIQTQPIFHSSLARVDRDDLQTNNKLLTEEQIHLVESALCNQPDGKYGKKWFKKIFNADLPFGVIKFKNVHYAIYKGTKRNKLLGQGAYARVKLLQNLENCQWYALKIQTDVAVASEEFQCLSTIKQGIGLFYYHSPQKNEEQAHIIEFLAPGAPLNVIFTNVSPLSIEQWLEMIIHILQALQDEHNAGYLHGDIKLDNVFYDVTSGKVQIIDHNLALSLKERDHLGNVSSRQLRYLDRFRAPEVIPNQEGNYFYNEKTDIFALGMLIAELFCCQPYYSCHYFKMKIPDPTVRLMISHHILRMTRLVPHLRPTLEESISFFQTVKEKRYPVINVNVSNNYGETALYAAANSGDEEVVRLLLAYPDINIISAVGMALLNKSRDGIALIIAATRQTQNSIQLLAEAIYLMVSSCSESLINIYPFFQEIFNQEIKKRSPDVYNALEKKNNEGHTAFGLIELTINHLLQQQHLQALAYAGEISDIKNMLLKEMSYPDVAALKMFGLFTPPYPIIEEAPDSPELKKQKIR